MAFPLDEKFIIKAEEELGASLPDEYRRMMMQQNGGRFVVLDDDWTFHPIFDTYDKKRLKRSANHILRETEARRGYSSLPEGAVEVAKNDFGDGLLLLRQGNRFGPNLHLILHETGTIADTGLNVGALAQVGARQ